MRDKPRITATKDAARSRLFRIEQIDLEFSNGQTRTFERLAGPARGAVMIIPMLDTETLLLIREYAAGIDQYELGFPKGLLEKDETPEMAANRELQEEIGYGAKKITYLKTLSTSPGYMAAKMHIVAAEDLYPEKKPGDEPEPLEIIKWPISQLKNLMEQNDVCDARTFGACYLFEKYLRNKIKLGAI